MKLLKIRLQKQHTIQDMLPRVSQTLIQNFRICIGDLVKDQFFFSKKREHPSSPQKKKAAWDVKLSPWALSQNRKSNGKTMRLGWYDIHASCVKIYTHKGIKNYKWNRGEVNVIYFSQFLQYFQRYLSSLLTSCIVKSIYNKIKKMKTG